ncbi:hypothetical protein NB231_04230 [Nitrococcus mobilis Nb-231]|uniref:Uncharacterized protein n=1 Tax=Nitrococcus mobilis Nb-231 TaxID=314278 RepID=A4BPT0_9GAMM|nr:hypothetical protein NB231_04230 [Nitrococcus mobilis Nb-231]
MVVDSGFEPNQNKLIPIMIANTANSVRQSLLSPEGQYTWPGIEPDPDGLVYKSRS